MVRNFYIKGSIDGRKTDLTGGPSRKDGGMTLHLTQRNHGSIEKCATIKCYAEGDVLKTIFVEWQNYFCRKDNKNNHETLFECL